MRRLSDEVRARRPCGGRASESSVNSWKGSCPFKAFKNVLIRISKCLVSRKVSPETKLLSKSYTLNGHDDDDDDDE
jgi:hypothetical protein